MCTKFDLGDIARNAHIVLQSFRALGNALNEEKETNDPDQSLVSQFENESSRFKMWAGNLGAHQRGSASLDYRLREAPHLQEQVVYLLQDLSQSLQDAISFVRHGPRSSAGVDHAQPNKVHEQEAFLRQNDDDQMSEDSLPGLDGDGDPQQGGLRGIHVDVTEAIDCLLRLSVAIANPAPHERVRHGAGIFEDVSFRETYDMGYVQDKFPKMDPSLARILGKAITRRRQFFKYREAHHAKLAEGLEMLAHGSGAEFGDDIVSRTVASSLPELMKTQADADIKTAVLDEDDTSDTGVSQTSYATSAGLLAGQGNDEPEGPLKPPPPLRVPPLPAAGERGSFECPFCYRMVSARTRAAWKRHVFGDLRPYTCLFADCADSKADFDRRRLWQAHVLQHHWQRWSCPWNCEGVFPSSTKLRDHLSQQHMPGAPEEQLNALTSFGKKTTATIDTATPCPVCRHTVVGLKQYIKHVGRHLEQLALFALPSLGDDKEPQDSGSDGWSHLVSHHDGYDTKRNADEVDWSELALGKEDGGDLDDNKFEFESKEQNAQQLPANP